MQFLLTEEEWKEFQDRPSVVAYQSVRAERQDLCQRLALATIGHCIAVPGSKAGYCDECPASETCSAYKEFSK